MIYIRFSFNYSINLHKLSQSTSHPFFEGEDEPCDAIMSENNKVTYLGH